MKQFIIFWICVVCVQDGLSTETSMKRILRRKFNAGTKSLGTNVKNTTTSSNPGEINISSTANGIIQSHPPEIKVNSISSAPNKQKSIPRTRLEKKGKHQSRSGRSTKQTKANPITNTKDPNVLSIIKGEKGTIKLDEKIIVPNDERLKNGDIVMYIHKKCIYINDQLISCKLPTDERKDFRYIVLNSPDQSGFQLKIRKDGKIQYADDAGQTDEF